MDDAVSKHGDKRNADKILVRIQTVSNKSLYACPRTALHSAGSGEVPIHKAL
jgi:hypothetical protein